MAGTLLAAIVHWAQYGQAKITGVEGKWVANPREWWMREACLTPAQYDKAIRNLCVWKLIERRQWWFGGKNILYVRPTELTSNFYQAMTTWAAINELETELERTQMGPPEICEITDPGSPNSTNSNELSQSADPSPPETMNSKYVSNSLESHDDELPSACPAAPTCAVEKKEVTGKQKGPGLIEVKQPAPKVDLLCQTWISEYENFRKSSPITPPYEFKGKDFGHLALLQKYLNRLPDEFSSHGADAIAFIIRNWSNFDICGKPPFPTTEFAMENFSLWVEAGCPVFFNAPPEAMNAI